MAFQDTMFRGDSRSGWIGNERKRNPVTPGSIRRISPMPSPSRLSGSQWSTPWGSSVRSTPRAPRSASPRPPQHLVDLQRSVADMRSRGDPRATEMQRSLVNQLTTWNPSYLRGGTTSTSPSAIPGSAGSGEGGYDFITGEGKEQQFDYRKFLESGMWQAPRIPIETYQRSARADAMTQAAALTNQQLADIGGGRPGLRAAIRGRGLMAGALQGVTAGNQASLGAIAANMQTDQYNIGNLFNIARGVEDRAASLRGDYRAWKNADIARTQARRDRQYGLWGGAIGTITGMFG